MNRPTPSLALFLLPFLLGCPEASCPTGETAVMGRCYPQEAVDSVGGGVPVLCESACAGQTPICNYTNGTCVACQTHAHCTSSTHPACDPVSHACVACVSDAQCESSDAPHCDSASHACVGCTADASCERFDETPRCNVADGRCIECTIANEATVCGANSCDFVTGLCSTTPRHSRGPCQSCASDSECGTNQRCTLLSWYQFPAERVCLWDASVVGCANSASSAIAPYAKLTAATTVHGTSVNVCAPPSVCIAMQNYVAHTACNLTSQCGGPAGSSLCNAGSCTMSCASIPTGYPGCVLGDDCSDGVWCKPIVP